MSDARNNALNNPLLRVLNPSPDFECSSPLQLPGYVPFEMAAIQTGLLLGLFPTLLLRSIRLQKLHEPVLLKAGTIHQTGGGCGRDI